MQPFTYVPASNVEEASREQQQPNSSFLGGGTCIVDLMKLYVMKPEHLIDVRRTVPAGIEDKGSSVLVSSSTFTNNSAQFGSGLLANANSTVRISNSTFANNIGSSAGAIVAARIELVAKRFAIQGYPEIRYPG